MFASLFLHSTIIIYCSLFQGQTTNHWVYQSWHIVLGLYSTLFIRVFYYNPSSIRWNQSKAGFEPGTLWSWVICCTARQRLLPSIIYGIKEYDLKASKLKKIQIVEYFVFRKWQLRYRITRLPGVNVIKIVNSLFCYIS